MSYKRNYSKNTKSYLENNKNNLENLNFNINNTHKQLNNHKQKSNSTQSTNRLHSISLSTQILDHINNNYNNNNHNNHNNNNNNNNKKHEPTIFRTNSKSNIQRSDSKKDSERKNLKKVNGQNNLQWSNALQNIQLDHRSKQWDQEEIKRMEQLSEQMQWMMTYQYPGLSEKWKHVSQYYIQISNLQSQLEQIHTSINSIQQQLRDSHRKLLAMCKQRLSVTRQQHYTSVGQLNSIIYQVQQSHQQLKRKLRSKDFEDVIMFNIKVILPSKSKKQSLQGSQLFGTEDKTSIYQQIFDNRLSKKLSLIAKKNNLLGNDSKAVNEHLKRVIELETQYHKLNTYCLQQLPLEDQQMDVIIHKIQQLQLVRTNLMKKNQKINLNIQDNKKQLKQYQNTKQLYLRQLNASACNQYKQTSSYSESVSFLGLITRQFESNFCRFQKVLQEKQALQKKHQSCDQKDSR